MNFPFVEQPYRPLPDSLTIKNSKIEGLGLFATENIPAGEVLGVSHLLVSHNDIDYEEKTFIVRTPLGGFINHSNVPNCEKVLRSDINMFFLVTTEPIKKGQELTLEYSFYSV
jgi:SET domain-containing protein